MKGPDVAQARLHDMLEPQEQWNQVHAQLLKSVADAQGRLLAAQNEICDRLDAQMKAVPALQAHRDKQIADLKVLVAQTHEAVRNSRVEISGRLEALVDIFRAKRQVERLRTKRIVKPPQRKQRR